MARGLIVLLIYALTGCAAPAVKKTGAALRFFCMNRDAYFVRVNSDLKDPTANILVEEGWHPTVYGCHATTPILFFIGAMTEEARALGMPPGTDFLLVTRDGRKHSFSKYEWEENIFPLLGLTI